MRALLKLLGAILFLAAIVGRADGQNQMPWQTNLQTAQQIATQSNRLVLIHFWSTTCQPCMRLETEVFSKAEVARALEANYVMVKINTDEAPATARYFGVSSIPTDIIVSPGGKLVSHFQSPPTANQYVAQLSQAAAGFRELNRPAQAAAVATGAQTGPPTNALGAAAGMPPAQPPVVVNPPAVQAAPPQTPTANDRYAEYYRHQPAQPSAAGVASAAPQPPGPPRGASQPQVQPQIPQLPPGCPPLALDGNCPVTLMERRNWALGDKSWGAIHRGRTYLFLGPQEREKFLANPDFFSPVLSGLDPVLALDNQTSVPGKREFGAWGPDKRIYLFADEASRARFEQNPKRYSAEALQAMR